MIQYPKRCVSEIHKRQITAVQDNSTHCLEVNGTFDNCKDIIKVSFADTGFHGDGVCLGTINSINWYRVLVQTT